MFYSGVLVESTLRVFKKKKRKLKLKDLQWCRNKKTFAYNWESNDLIFISNNGLFIVLHLMGRKHKSMGNLQQNNRIKTWETLVFLLFYLI